MVILILRFMGTSGNDSETKAWAGEEIQDISRGNPGGAWKILKIDDLQIGNLARIEI
jgi:hypothetical protein